jgi:hypothetical protein
MSVTDPDTPVIVDGPAPTFGPSPLRESYREWVATLRREAVAAFAAELHRQVLAALTHTDVQS